MSKTVQARELSNFKMVAGNESVYSIVIDNGTVKEWTGIGWIPLHKATSKDFKQYPTVQRSETE